VLHRVRALPLQLLLAVAAFAPVGALCDIKRSGGKEGWVESSR